MKEIDKVVKDLKFSIDTDIKRIKEMADELTPDDTMSAIRHISDRLASRARDLTNVTDQMAIIKYLESLLSKHNP